MGDTLFLLVIQQSSQLPKHQVLLCGGKYKKAELMFLLTLRHGVCSVCPVTRQLVLPATKTVQRSGARVLDAAEASRGQLTGARAEVCFNGLHQPVSIPSPPATQVLPKLPTAHSDWFPQKYLKKKKKGSVCVTLQSVTWPASLRGPAALAHVRSYSSE